MFGQRFELFRLFGFAVRIDSSWFLLAALITWTLATGYFPSVVQELAVESYWMMGALGALGLFASVVLHELSHSLVARRSGIEMKGITLFLFGGVAEMSQEPPSPRVEFRVAIAGPLASLAIAAICSTLLHWIGAPDSGSPTAAVVGYLALVNGMLAIFNLIPAFPLDGGRILRALLWKMNGSYRWSTRITSQIGSFFGTALMILGLITILRGSAVNGIWWLLIGLFIRSAASMSYQQVLLRQALEGEPVARFMSTDLVAVPRSISVRDLVDQFVYRHHFKMFPVVDQGQLVGCVTTREIKGLEREQWENQSVGAIAIQCGPENTVAPEQDAMEALAQMNRQKVSRLMVVDQGHLLGILTLKDLLAFLASKIELGDLPETIPDLPAGG